MELKDVIEKVIDKAYGLLPAKMNSIQATLMLLAIGMQESKFASRQQLITKVVNGKKTLVPEGPAVSFWQFEAGGGVRGVMLYHSTKALCRQLCDHFGVAFEQKAIWEAMKNNDVLGACMARLLLFTDPLALPKVGEERVSWELYARTWRPGKPHPETWPDNYSLSRTALGV